MAKKRLGIRLSKPQYDQLTDEDDLDNSLPRDLRNRLTIRGKGGVDVAAEAARLVEAGKSLSPEELAAQIDQVDADSQSYRTRHIRYKRALAAGFACTDLTAAEAFAAWEDRGVVTPYHVGFTMDGIQVTVCGSYQSVDLPVQPSGSLAHVFVLSPYTVIYDSMKIEAWVRHVAGHAAGARFVTAMMCMKDDPLRTYRPLSRAEALSELQIIIRQALKPMTCDVRRTSGADDTLPGDFAAAVARYEESVVSTYGR